MNKVLSRYDWLIVKRANVSQSFNALIKFRALIYDFKWGKKKHKLAYLLVHKIKLYIIIYVLNCM